MLGRHLKRKQVILFMTALPVFVPVYSKASQNSATLSQQGLAAILRHQESLVQSMECTFDVMWSPTAPENIPLLYQICKELNHEYDPEAEPYIVDEELAERLSTVTHWWRKGDRERENVYSATNYNPADLSRPIKQNAFDGQILRTLGPGGDGGVAGVIETAQGGLWTNVNRTHPYSFMYQFMTMPYSQIVNTGTNFSVTKVVRDGKDCARVSVEHPTIDRMSFVLIYDDEFRLMQWDMIRQIAPDPKPRLYERYVLSNYKKYEDQSGEVIWFPSKAVYHLYGGDLPDGTPVEVFQKTVNIRQIKFNVDIPDEKFVLKFPLGTKIWDGVGGLGWMENTLESVREHSLTAVLQHKIDQGVRTLAQAGQANGPPAKTTSDVTAKGDIEDEVVVPASEVPLGQLGPSRTSRWWAICGLIVGLLLLTACIYWLVRTHRTRTAADH